MPNIRIKDIPTTASATSSTDFIGIDGSANGTRKLDAYSPTFGGNLTVSGGTITGGTSGLSLASGGANQNITLWPSGVSGLVNVYGSLFQPTLVQLNGGLLRMSNGRQWNLVTNATVYQLQDGSAGGNSFTVTGGGPSVGNFTVNYTTASSSTTTGALVVSGGVGVAGATYVGGALDVAGAAHFAGANQRLHVLSDGVGGTFSLNANWNGSSFDNPGLPGGGRLRVNWQGVLELGKTTDGSTWSNVFVISNQGNALIGTTTDSGNGKLQLATHTTSAGGIGFGTDVSLYRTTSNILTFGAGNACGFYLRDTNTSTNLSEFYSDTSQTFFGTKTALPLIIRTNNTTALTLDSSQNATFAGSIRQNQANNISLTSGVATTIFSLGTSAGVYIVTATLDVNAVAGYAIVGKGATGSWQVLANSGTQMSFSMSTNDLQITQTSGSTSTANTFNLLRLR